MDKIEIRSLRAMGKHGVHAEEREHEQPFDIDVVIEIDLQAAGRSDNLTDTLDYDALRTRIVQLVETTSFALLERLAEEIYAVIFTDARVRSAEVRLAKPGILAGATPAVVLVRENPAFRG